MNKGFLFGMSLGLGCLACPCIWAIYNIWLSITY